MTRLFHVPRPPLNYLPRPDQLEPLVEQLLSARSEAVGVVGVQGMGGIGKSVLSAAACGDPRIQEAFPDGIYWLTLGQTPDLVAVQRQLAHDLGMPLTEIQLLDAALGRSELENRFDGKAALLVVDDVWYIEHAEQLCVMRPPGRVLITTRDQGMLQGLGAAVHRVDLLSLDESLDLLAKWAGQSRESLPLEAAEVARECGRLPLALAMVGAMVQRRQTAWSDALTRLRQHDLLKLRTQFVGYKHPDLLRAIQTSVDGLDDDRVVSRFGRDVRQRYLELAVFPEDEPIPETALAVLWGAAGLDQADVRDLMDEFVSRSLAKWSERKTETGRSSSRRSTRHDSVIRLHDLQADYVLGACGDVSRLHAQLVDAYSLRYSDGFASVADDGYYFDHLAYHLFQADRRVELYQLLRDADWLEARLATCGPAALIGDFRWIEPPDTHCPAAAANAVEKDAPHASQPNFDELHELRMLRDGVRLSAHILMDDPTQLASQLTGRLDGSQMTTLRLLLMQLGQPQPQGMGAEPCARYRSSFASRPFFSALGCSLHPPGAALLRTLAGHMREVLAVAVTPDGRCAISASGDGTLRMWDLETGTTLHTLRGHTKAVVAVAVTPDGRRAISASDDDTLRLWDLTTGTIVHIYQRIARWVHAMTVMPDGRRVISASSGWILRVWDLESGMVVRTLDGHRAWIRALAVTPNGRRAITASHDNTLRVWDLDSWQLMQTVMMDDASRVRAVALTPDGRRAVSSSDDKSLRVWDLKTGTAMCIVEGDTAEAGALTVTPDGLRAISAYAEKGLRIWDLETLTIERSLEGHSDAVVAVAVTPDGRRAISASLDRTLRVWDLEARTVVPTRARHSSEILAIAITPDGQRVISASHDQTLRIWDMESRTTARTLAGHTSMVSDVVVTPDGRHAVSASADQTLRYWDLKTAATLRTLVGHSERINSVVVTPDGRRSVSASDDETLRVWDLVSGTTLRTLAGHSDGVCRVAVTPDSSRAISASYDGTLRVWDLEQGRIVHILEGHKDWVVAVAVTRNGLGAISASYDQTLRLWDLTTGQLVHTLEGHKDWVVAVAVTPDGSRAISASFDQTLRVWDLKTGRLARALAGHEMAVRAVIVTPDGRHVVSASDDQTFRMWDVETGTTVATFTGEDCITSCAVAPDGRTFVAGDVSGCVHLLRLILPEPSVRGAKRVTIRTSATGEIQFVKKTSRDQVFISYSHEDQLWLEQLQKHLKPYVRNATIAVWDDTKIRTGNKWRTTIADALAAARVGVLLVSPNFLASDFIAEQELPPLLQAAAKEGLTIVWIPISASAFKQTPIAEFQAAHAPTRPLDSLSPSDQNQAWVAICEKIAAAYAES